MKRIHKLLIFAVVVLVFFRFFLPGPHVANDLHYTFKADLVGQFSLPSVWEGRFGSGLGEYAVSVLWSWPIQLVFGFFAKLGFSHDLLMKIVGLPPILVIGLFGMYKLLGYLRVNKWARLVGILIFLLNSYFILLIDGGQISLAIAYSLLPLTWFFYKRVQDANILREFPKFLIALIVISISDIRIVYFLVLLIVFDFFFGILITKKISFSYILKYIKLAIVSGIVLLAFHSYWIFPSYFSRPPSLPETYTRISQISFLSFAQLKHSVLLLQPHWPENIFGKIAPIKKEFILIPILAFAAPFLKRKKEVYFWTLVALASIFLVKGNNPPLSSVYPWLFGHVPGFSLFRDPTKFFFLVALSYSVLIAFTVEEVTRKFSKVKMAFPLLVIAYFLFLMSPVYTGKMTGTFSSPQHKNEYFALADKFENDGNFGRILWIPSKSPLGFSSQIHPSIEALNLSEKRPFQVGTVGTYESINFLREASYMGEIMKIAGVKYLVYPYPDARRVELKPEDRVYYQAFLSQLTNLSWILGKVFDFPILVLQTKESKDHFFIAPNTYFVVGSDVLYSELVKIKDFDLSKNALIWGEESPGMGVLVGRNIPDKVVLFKKKILDLVASFVDKNNFIFPGKNLEFSPGKNGWWKRETNDFVWFRDFLQQKYGIDNIDFDYGGGWAIAESSEQLSVSSNQFSEGNVLLARVMSSGRGGKVVFYQGDILIGEVNTKIDRQTKATVRLTGYKNALDKVFEYNVATFDWFQIGKFVSDKAITIKTEGDINVVNALIAAPESELRKFELQSNDLMQQGKVVYWDDLTISQKEALFMPSSVGELSYKELAPTHYKIAVSGIKKPVALVFSEAFDPFWELNGVSSIHLYSLINGFKIDHDGEYNLYFSGQKYVLPGLILSGFTLVVILSSLLILQRQNV